MGWTGQPKDGRTTQEVVIEELSGTDSDGRTWEVIAHSGKYYALKLPNDRVIGVVALTEHGRQYGETWIYTKMVSEDWGPNERECPKRILDKLSPLPEDQANPEVEGNYAAQWRRDCLANIELKAKQPKLKIGDRIRIPNGVTFIGDWTATDFTFEGRYTFRAANGIRVRLPKNWKWRYTWEKVA